MDDCKTVFEGDTIKVCKNVNKTVYVDYWEQVCKEEFKQTCKEINPCLIANSGGGFSGQFWRDCKSEVRCSTEPETFCEQVPRKLPKTVLVDECQNEPVVSSTLVPYGSENPLLKDILQSYHLNFVK